MRSFVTASALFLSVAAGAQAATVYPLDRATIMAGSPFDLKVELEKQTPLESVGLFLNGKPLSTSIPGKVGYVAKEEGAEGSALILRDAVLARPGRYEFEVRAGSETKKVVWEVFGAASEPKVKNVIFFLGDGLSIAHRTAARIMARGMTEGKADGRLALDDMERMAFIGTSSTNSIATDSANTMSAYMTGHKTAVNAIGVYADRTADPFDDPKVETIAEALRRVGNKSIGIVTTSEPQDATPAAVVAHTRKRSEKARIAEMLFDVRPDVVMGGGSAYFLPKSTPGSKRKDDRDLIAEFANAGYSMATDAAGLESAAARKGDKLLGLFHTGNMDTWLDRERLKKGTVSTFPDQPGLVRMTEVALDRLSSNKDGFFLMVEGASIDKMSHPMDWERAIVETIEFDRAIAAAQKFAAKHPDTLIIVTGDHTHGVSIVGTIDDDKPGEDMREKLGVYADSGFPNYTHEKDEYFPDRVDVSRRLAVFSSNFPDYYETFGPKLDDPFVPAVKDEKGNYVANQAYKDLPGAVLRVGNLPRNESTAVHAVDDVVLQASGPGSEAFKGYMEQSDVYKILADALGLGGVRK